MADDVIPTCWDSSEIQDGGDDVSILKIQDGGRLPVSISKSKMAVREVGEEGGGEGLGSSRD